MYYVMWFFFKYINPWDHGVVATSSPSIFDGLAYPGVSRGKVAIFFLFIYLFFFFSCIFLGFRFTKAYG